MVIKVIRERISVQKPNLYKFESIVNRTRILIANTPDKKARIVATVDAKFISRPFCIIVYMPAPKIVGIPNKNEKSKASFLLTPKTNPATSVTPALEIPGNKAKA